MPSPEFFEHCRQGLAYSHARRYAEALAALKAQAAPAAGAATLTLGPGAQGTLTLGPAQQGTLTLGPGGAAAGVAAGSAWRPGSVVDELYEVREELGEGGFGTVHKVYHRGWKLELAVKSLRTDRLGSGRAVENFVQEANTWVGLGLHPNIVTCFFVRVMGAPRIFIEYMEGGSLADWLKAGKVTGLPEALDMAIQLARGMAYAHSRGLVHRDLKPGNCLITPGGTLKVTDFGLAKLGAAGEDEPADDGSRGAKLAKVKGATQTGRLGTPEYMAPEQWDRPREAGPAADSWAFGVMLHELCLGQRPFKMADDEPVDAFYVRLLESNWAYAKPRDLPAEVSGLMTSCLNVDAAKRPVDFKGMAELLETAYASAAGKPYPRERVKEPPLMADTVINQGVSMADLGRTDEALRLFGEALKLDPTHPGAIYNQGALLIDAGKLDAGELASRLKECAKSRGKEWSPRYLAGLALMLRKDFASARTEFDAAAELSHDNPLVRRALGHCGEADWGGFKELFVALPRGVEAAAMEEGSFKALLARAEKEFSLGEHERAYATGMKARQVKGYERAAEAMDLLRRVGGKGKRKKLRGWWQRGLLEGSEGALSVAISPDGSQVLSGHAGDVVKRWEPLSGVCAGTAAIAGGVKGVSRCQTPDGRFALEAAGRTLKVLESGTGLVAAELSDQAREIWSVCLSRDGGMAFTAGEDGVRCWVLDWEYFFQAEPVRAANPAAQAQGLGPGILAAIIILLVVMVSGYAWIELRSGQAERAAPRDAAEGFDAARAQAKGAAALPAAAPAAPIQPSAPPAALSAMDAQAEQARQAKVAGFAAEAGELLARKKYMAAMAELKKANALGGSPEVDALVAQIAGGGLRAGGDVCNPDLFSQVAPWTAQRSPCQEGFSSLVLDVPNRVGPGESVPISMRFQRCAAGCNPNAVLYSSFLGDWQKDSPLSMRKSYFTGCGETAMDSATITAPTRAGKYRIRWVLCMAFAGIQKFCGDGPPGDSSNPGVCPYVEKEFLVIGN